VPARQRQHLHVPYQICYHFLKNTKKYRRGDARQNPPEIPGGNTPPAVRLHLEFICHHLPMSGTLGRTGAMRQEPVLGPRRPAAHHIVAVVDTVDAPASHHAHHHHPVGAPASRHAHHHHPAHIAVIAVIANPNWVGKPHIAVARHIAAVRRIAAAHHIAAAAHHIAAAQCSVVAAAGAVGAVGENLPCVQIKIMS
jgi:hypothetical protein